MTTHPLSAAQKQHVIEAIESTLRHECPELFQGANAGSAGGWPDVVSHVDELVEIVRHSTAARIEPYLAQILEDICARCPQQFPSGYCPLRHTGLCVLYRHAQPIVRAIIGALSEMRDPEFQKAHGAIQEV